MKNTYIGPFFQESGTQVETQVKRTHPRKRRKRSKSAEILLFLPSTFMVWGCYACCLHFFDLFSWTCDFEGRVSTWLGALQFF